MNEKYTLHWTSDVGVIEYTHITAPSVNEASNAARMLADERGYKVGAGSCGVWRGWSNPKDWANDFRYVEID